MKTRLLRITGIISTIIIVAVFFGTAEIFKEQIEADTQKPNFENPFLPYAGLFLFGIPPKIIILIQ